MRPVLHSDVVTAARHLLTVPDFLREMVIRKLIFRADAADAFRRRSGICHRLWGDGTLEAVASQYRLAPEPFLNDQAYCTCMELVFAALLECSHERATNKCDFRSESRPD
jgi:hypothetical protein